MTSLTGRTGTRKSLGQHFLADTRTAGRILDAADLSPDDLIVEIGPGRGVLTRRLVERVRRVVAIELDGELAAALPSRLACRHTSTTSPPWSTARHR